MIVARTARLTARTFALNSSFRALPKLGLPRYPVSLFKPVHAPVKLFTVAGVRFASSARPNQVSADADAGEIKAGTAKSPVAATPAKENEPESSEPFTKSERAEQAKNINLSAKLSKTPKSKSQTEELKRLFALVRNEKVSLFLALTLLLLTSAISLTLPAIIGKVLDTVNGSSEEEPKIWGLTMTQFFTGAGIMFVVNAVALGFRIVLMRSIGERIVSRLRAKAFRRIIEQDAEFFDANRTGDLISRLGTDANVVSKAVTQNMSEGFRSVIAAVAGVAMMSYISLQLTAIITVILPPVMIGTWLYGRKVRAIALNFQSSLGQLTRVAEERLNNIRTAQSFGGETQEIRAYNTQIRKVFGIAMQDARANGYYYSSLTLTGHMVVIGLLGLGANMVSKGTLTFGELSSFIMYTAYAGASVGGLANFYTELMKGAGAAARLFEIDDRQPQISPYKGQVLQNPRGKIEFHNVKFSYPTRPSVQIFTGLNATIRPGSHVVIVGQSGGGKSTIMSLLMRFYDPTDGYITIGGQKLTDISPWALRTYIGVVAQEPVLFNASIADNIKYSKPDATRAEVMAAAAQANCTFLSDFPDGIDTQVGPRGTQLSGGQKQRIAIARAIIAKPAILILDEATSALDGESEMLVNEALKKLITSTSTTISIAHRLSTISQAEEVIVLGNGGKVVEQGGFTELYDDPHSALNELLVRRHELVPGKGNEHKESEENDEERNDDSKEESEEDYQEDKVIETRDQR